VASPPHSAGPSTRTAAPRSVPFSVVTGLASLGVLRQGVWAGLFLREGQGNDPTWVTVYARGAEITTGLAVIAAVIAVVQLRSRREVVIGGVVFVLLLALEAYIGGEIGAHSKLQVIPFPLALALTGLAVWLPPRAGRRVTAAG